MLEQALQYQQSQADPLRTEQSRRLVIRGWIALSVLAGAYPSAKAHGSPHPKDRCDGSQGDMQAAKGYELHSTPGVLRKLLQWPGARGEKVSSGEILRFEIEAQGNGDGACQGEYGDKDEEATDEVPHCTRSGVHWRFQLFGSAVVVRGVSRDGITDKSRR